MTRIGSKQRYREHVIVRTHAGCSVTYDGRHIFTAADYQAALAYIDAIMLRRKWIAMLDAAREARDEVSFEI